MGADLVDKERDDGPPQQGSQDDGGVAEDDMVELVFGQGETESREQGDNQEDDEGIAQGEQESRHGITPLVLALVDVLGNLAHGVVDNHVERIDNQDGTADDLQDVDMVGDEVGHQRDSQADEQAVEQVAGGGTDSGEEAGITSLVQGALNAEDTDRTHRCRQDNTY